MRPLTCLRVLAAIYLIACVELSSGAEVGLSHQGGTDLIIFSEKSKRAIAIGYSQSSIK